MVSADRTVLLDACVAINLVATGIPLAEFAASGALWLGKRAADEVMYLEAADQEVEREFISLRVAAANGQITVVELTEAEVSTFVDLARVVDDGEAEALAIADARGVVLATDDRKARRLAAEMDAPVHLTSTPAMMRQWASAEPRPAAAELADALRAIETRASFVPPRNDPEREWWLGSVGREG